MHSLLFLLLNIVVAHCAEFPDPSVVDPQIAQQAAQIASGFQGAYVVAKQGKVLAISGVGLANKSTGEKNSVYTSFRLASVSKPIAAVAILQLYEDGRLDVKDLVSKHLPDYGENGKRITLHQLLTHSSGIPDYINFIDDASSPKAVIDSFRTKALQFTPGTQHSYSNSNFSLLGYIVEKITGMSYWEYVQQNIWEPAHMKHSGFFFPKVTGLGFAGPSGGNPNGPFESNMKAYASGALYASVVDMLYFNHALYDGVLLKPETVKLMQTRYISNAGYGCFVNGDTVSHNGSIAGFTSQLYTYPKTQGLVMVFSNGTQGAGGLAQKLSQLL